MARERGLPSIPRGLSRDLTIYLQALQNVVLSISGLGPGTEKTRALRVSEGAKTGAASAVLGVGAVSTRHIGDGAVTTSKLSDGCVTSKKLSPSAVGTRELAGGAVTADALSAASVSPDKLSDLALSVGVSGIAADGETVNIGGWYGEPHVAVIGFAFPAMANGEMQVGIKNLREIAGEWLFDVVASIGSGEEETEAQTACQGEISWRASGIRRAANDE